MNPDCGSSITGGGQGVTRHSSLVRSTSTIKSYHVVTFARNGHPWTSRRRIPPAQQVQAVE